MSFLMRGSIQLATFLYSTNIVPKIQSISKIYDTRTRSEPHTWRSTSPGVYWICHFNMCASHLLLSTIMISIFA